MGIMAQMASIAEPPAWVGMDAAERTRGRTSWLGRCCQAHCLRPSGRPRGVRARDNSRAWSQLRAPRQPAFCLVGCGVAQESMAVPQGTQCPVPTPTQYAFPIHACSRSDFCAPRRCCRGRGRGRRGRGEAACPTACWVPRPTAVRLRPMAEDCGRRWDYGGGTREPQRPFKGIEKGPTTTRPSRRPHP
jgi:hypothetical protein